jgi:solute:Na+ symporter, SSS family
MHIELSPIDYAIIGVYFVFVIGVGFALKRQMVSSEDFFLAGHRIPSWVTGLAFISANLGAIEVMGMAANGAQYGIMTAHFYWLGAIPAMVFLGIFMMPFYYGSKVRSVPEYLKMRFNEPTRALNAISFAVMTVLMSGVNLYAMALVFQLLLHWNVHASIVVAACVVLAYTYLGGLTSSIYNEVLQFFLIVFGLFPISFIGLSRLGGWEGLKSQFHDPRFAHLWLNAGTAANPMGVDWIGLVSGLGFVLSFGYWCTDFLVIQRALAAESLSAAQRTPLIAAVPKVFFPILTVLPGLLAVVLIPQLGSMKTGEYSWNMAMPLLLAQLYPSGMLGLGLTAMLASFMSGMAGNVTAFNTVWTYDLYQSYIAKDKSDEHYLWMGHMATAGGILISIATAYLVMGAPSIMDYMQLIFSFFNAPLFATFLLGMFWKRCSPWGAFWGLVIGTVVAIVHYLLTDHIFNYTSVMAGNFWRATYAWIACFACTILISFFTKPKDESELVGLVYGLSRNVQTEAEPWYKRPATIGCFVGAITLVANIIFW